MYCAKQNYHQLYFLVGLKMQSSKLKGKICLLRDAHLSLESGKEIKMYFKKNVPLCITNKKFLISIWLRILYCYGLLPLLLPILVQIITL